MVTPEGFPIAYKVLVGNTSDKDHPSRFSSKKSGAQHGADEPIWMIDRGIPTEEVLGEMRKSDPSVAYIVGTPKGCLQQAQSG